MSYNEDTKENMLHLVSPDAPAKLVASFAFDSGYWKVSTLDVSVFTESV